MVFERFQKRLNLPSKKKIMLLLKKISESAYFRTIKYIKNEQKFNKEEVSLALKESTMTNNDEPIQSETTARVFPLPGTMHYNMVIDEKSKQNYYKWFKRINRVIVPLYKLRLLPLFGFGRIIMLLTTKGRKSGKKRTIPIGLFRINDILHVISGWGEEANWYKNMIANPDDIHVQVGFRTFHARAEVVEDPDENKQIMKWLVMNRPRDAKSMGWDFKQDDPETADFSLMIKLSRVVRFHRRT